MNRIRTENENKINVTKLSDSVASYLTKYESTASTPKGAFFDVDYAGTERTIWSPSTHISRLYDFVFSYTMPGSAYYRNETLYTKIVDALQYWYDCNPHSSNWWHNQIGEPQPLGILLIQMRKGEKKLPVDLVTATIARMRADGGAPGTGNATSGANLMDVATHVFYRALLTADKALLTATLDKAYGGVKYAAATEEGLQIDHSNFSHGTQLYIGGYGDDFIKGITLFAMYTVGTEYALPAAKAEIVSDFVRNAYLKTIRGKFMVWDVSGRGILSRKGESHKVNAITYCQRMCSIDPAHAVAYQQAIDRIKGEQPASYGITPDNTHYFIADYTLHTRPAFLFDVRMASARTVRIEYGNGENLKSFFASDGCHNIVTRGDEYEEIFPVWNWTRIPGITCRQVANIPLSANDWQQKGISSFAGSVSDSLYAVTGYYYGGAYTGNSARKGYFFFDDEMVCLGSDITSETPSNTYVTAATADFTTADDDVNTTVNQCLLRGDVTISTDGSRTVLTTKGEHPYTTAPDWVLHDTIGYVFPHQGNIVVSNKTQTGNWYDINTSMKNVTVSKDVFSLWFNHGKSADKAQYAYIVVPNKTAAELDAYTANNPIEIQANTDSMQVVRHKTLGILGVIFYKAATFTCNEISLQADRACILLVKPGETGYSIHVADPVQAQTNIQVRAKVPASSDKWEVIDCNFAETGSYKGATKAYATVFHY
jgi:chondroitin AC lyase